MSQKVAYVTGGMGGIGTAICQRLSKEGFTVIAGCGPTRDYAKWLAEQAALGYTFYASAGNVGDWESTVEAFSKAKAEHGNIDVLINNAGITRDAMVHKMDEDQWNAVIDVNLKGVFLCGREAARRMRERGSGVILNTTSVVGLYGNIGQTNYAATKAGVIAMTKTWAKELGKKGVRCNAVAPGYTMTEMMQTVPEKVLAGIREKTPLNRLGEPFDIAAAFAFLASDDAAFVTGHTLSVDGGLTI